MYLPKHFEIKDPKRISKVINEYSFATLITHDGEKPCASHLPMLYRPEQGSSGTLISHMTRANAQWQQFNEQQEVLAIFQGPHAYVSPSWYVNHPSVPTWNYVVAHVYGKTRLIVEPEKVSALLRDTIAKYESARPQPWTDDLPQDYREHMMKAIVAFEISIKRVEAKFKLGQNRKQEDIAGVMTALSQSGDPQERQLASIMAEFLNQAH